MNDNTVATGTTVMTLQQDSTGAFLTCNDGGTNVFQIRDGGQLVGL